MKKKILSSIIILLILSIGLVSQVNAASSTTVKTEESKIKQISLVNSPTISFDIDKEKLADVKINVKDSKKISEVKIYEIPNKNKSKKEDITNKLTPKKISDKEYVYTMSHKNFLKSENKYFIIEAINESKSSLYMEFTLKKVTNAETKKTYYGLNRAPIISQIKIENDKLVFRTIEYYGMKNVLVKDLNNKNNEVLKKENVNKGVTEYSIPLSNLTKTKEGMYTIRIDGTEANQDGYARVSRRRISFKVAEKVGKAPTEEVVNPKMNKTNVELRKNQTTILSVSGVKSKAISWKSSDESVASILLKAETQAKITAKKVGKATITVKVGDKELKSTITVQDSFINSPTISFDIDKEKLADVKMHVKDANGISEVKIFNITTGKSGPEITGDLPVEKVSENEYIYTISDKNLLKEGKVYFKIIAKNTKNCYINMEFTVSKVKNAETKKTYYGVNRAPTMINMKVGTSKFSFRALEFWGMEKFELQDVNNNNNVVFKRENLRKGSTDYSIKLSDLKEGSDGMYKIKMIAKEAARNGEARTIYRTIKFRKAVKDTPAPTEEVKPKLDKSTVVLEGKTFELLTVSDTGSKAISWKAEDDNIVDVVLKKNNIARLRAKKAGKTTVIARVGSEEIKCEVIVPEISQKEISIIKGNSTTLKLNNIDTKKTVTYKSSNEKIATVDKNGKVEARSVGSATVTTTYEGKKYKSQITTMEKAAIDGYYYTIVNGYRIYYKKSGNNYKRLNGLTNYSEDAKDNYNKMYAGTNEILKAIGYIKKDNKNESYTRKYDFRILIVADSNAEKCTLTALAKDENGKYSIPVKTSLCVLPKSAKNLKLVTLNGNKDITKLGGIERTVDISQSESKRPERQSSWYKYSDKILAPGTISTQGGFYQSLFYNNTTEKKVLNNSCYTEMGTASSSGSIRLYWQDLKWIYENCKAETVGIMVRTSKAFTPFGDCTKIDSKTNTTQENPSYKLTKRYLNEGTSLNEDGYYVGMVEGYYYKKLANGFRIYYKKENGKYRMLDGRTDYSANAMNKDFNNSNSNAMYKDTNEILKAIGYKEGQYDFRIIIGAEKNLQRCTLTVLAKDEKGKYTVPVRSCLIGLWYKYKSCVTYSPVKLTANTNIFEKKFLQGQAADVNNRPNEKLHNVWLNYKGQGTLFTPGTIPSQGGYYHGITHQNNIISSYDGMGKTTSNGCNRLYWQDLKWIYENCPTGTKGRKLYITEPFEPFGKCEKLNRSTNRTQENAQYTLERKCDYNSSNSTARQKAINAGKKNCYIPCRGSKDIHI